MKAALSVAAIGAIATMGIGAGAAGASAGPTQYFTISSSSESAVPTVVASGPISANGTDTIVRRHLDDFVFPEGTVSVRHEPLTNSQSFDDRTCTFTFRESGTYSITRGTGAYAHATGSGKYKVLVIASGCDRNEPPTSFSQTIQAHGPITLGS